MGGAPAAPAPQQRESCGAAEAGAGLPPADKGGGRRGGGKPGFASGPPATPTALRGRGGPLGRRDQGPLSTLLTAGCPPSAPRPFPPPLGGSRPLPPPPSPFIYRHHQHARAVTQRQTPQRPPAAPPPRPLAARRAPPRPAIGCSARHTALSPAPSPRSAFSAGAYADSVERSGALTARRVHRRTPFARPTPRRREFWRSLRALRSR